MKYFYLIIVLLTTMVSLSQSKYTTPFFTLNCNDCILKDNVYITSENSYAYRYEPYSNSNSYSLPSYHIKISKLQNPNSISNDKMFEILKRQDYNFEQKYFMFNGNKAIISENIDDSNFNLTYIHFIRHNLHFYIAIATDKQTNFDLNDFERNFKPLFPERFVDNDLKVIEQEVKPTQSYTYSFSIDGKSYVSTEPFTFIQNASTHSYYSSKKYIEPIELSIGKKSNGGVVFLQKNNLLKPESNSDYFSSNDDFKITAYIEGDLYLYLDNGEIIHCTDREIYGYTDDTSGSIYYLTNNEIEKLKKSNIKKITYGIEAGSLNEVRRYSATTTDKNSSTATSVKTIFD